MEGSGTVLICSTILDTTPHPTPNPRPHPFNRAKKFLLVKDMKWP